jgi:hypothetical protein
MTLLPFADCCLWLGVDPKTLRLWLKAANLSCCVHPSDARLKCLTPSQLQHLADLHGRRLPHPLPVIAEDTASYSSVPAPEALMLAPDADLRHQVTHLQAQVTALSQQVAELALALVRERDTRGPERTSQLKTPLSPLMAQLPSVPQADTAALASRPPGAVPSEVVAERAPARALARSRTRALAHSRARALALIEYWAEGTYGIIAPTQGVLALVPDSPAWFDWLATLSSFRFVGQQGRLSASRTKGRSSWMAYRRIHGQNYAYGLGQTVHLTIARLEHMAATLQSHVPSR